MPDQYLLPCKCGKSIPVEPTQAGQAIECPACQSSLEIPSYSQIKKLQPQVLKAEENSKSRREKNWNLRQGVLFTVGMAMFIIFGSLGGLLFLWSYSTNVETPTVRAEMKENFGTFVDSMTPAERFAFWEEDQKKHPPTEWKPASHQFMQTFSKTFLTFAIICSVFSMIGLGCILSAFLVKKDAQRKRGKPKATP